MRWPHIPVLWICACGTSPAWQVTWTCSPSLSCRILLSRRDHSSCVDQLCLPPVRSAPGGRRCVWKSCTAPQPPLAVQPRVMVGQGQGPCLYLEPPWLMSRLSRDLHSWAGHCINLNLSLDLLVQDWKREECCLEKGNRCCPECSARRRDHF